MSHPMQPIVFADPEHPNNASFKPNAIVVFLKNFARKHGMDYDLLLDMNWSQEDWDQFMQLTGYSVNGYGELSHVSNEAKEAAEAAAEKAARTRDSGPLIVAHLPECLDNSRRGCAPGCPNYDPEYDGL